MLDSLACLAVKILGAFLCWLPPRQAIGLGARFGSIAYRLQSRRTRIGVANLQAAFDGEMTRAQARRVIQRCYRHLGESVFELLRLPVIDRAYIEHYITVEGRHHFDAALASGRPIIILTGHFGSWEMCSITAALLGYPSIALARAQKKMPKLYRLLVSYRESKGCTIVHKGGAMRRLIAALEKRELVGIVGDQASRQGIFVPFFNRPALFATGPFELAHSRNALIVHVFIHRTDGPYHRLVVEPIWDSSKISAHDQAIAASAEHFASLLARHIQEDPSQWLWMHKRWKRTPSRRVLVLSDGKAGHVKQSLAAVEWLRQQNPAVTSQIVEIKYRNRFARAAAFLGSAVIPFGWGAEAITRWCLSKKSAHDLLRRTGDVILSCGSSVAPINVLWSALHRAKSVAIMTPPSPLVKRFNLVIAPKHDAVKPRKNCVTVTGALTGPVDPESVRQSIDQIQRHPNFRAEISIAPHAPVISVLIGGETADFTMPDAWMEKFIGQIHTACREASGVCAATTSRRTSESAERLLKERLANHPCCQLMLLASRDKLNGTMDGLLNSASVIVVTGESISMVSEACSSGRPVVAVRLPRRAKSKQETKHDLFLRQLQTEGLLEIASVDETAQAVKRALARIPSQGRLDPGLRFHEALSRLLI